MKKIIVMGGAGFIGSHLAKRLKEEGNWVKVVDIELNKYMKMEEFCNEFSQVDLRDPKAVASVIDNDIDELYQLAALMGGAGFIFTGDNDADIMYSSGIINLNIARECVEKGVKRVFYSSSACIYPACNQEDPDNPYCEESSAYPSSPDSEYGWEKLFSERVYLAFAKNHGLTTRIARYHNIFGPQGTWQGGREKAPAAICRKVAEAIDIYARDNKNLASSIDIWGPGDQSRSFLYIDECVEGTIRLMRSNCTKVVNIGSDEMITINDLAKMTIGISGKNLAINNIPGPTGVRGRNSHNTLIEQELGWRPSQPLEEGIRKLYKWIEEQVNVTV